MQVIGPMLLWPIGIIHTPYQRLEDIPRQGRHSKERCEIEVYPEYTPGLKDIERCTHLFILFWLHLGDRSRLVATPPHDGREHGVFATRSPNRPNLLALDIVELLEARENHLVVTGMDALDCSILLDIKPYSAGIDAFPLSSVGWESDSENDPDCREAPQRSWGGPPADEL